MTFVEGVPPSKHFRCITQRHVLRSPITQPNIPEEQVAYRQFPRPSPLPKRRGYARLAMCVHENARAIIAHSGVCAIALARALLVEQSMDCPREAWIHALRSSIHGLSESMLCGQHMYIATLE